jgi:hypothetical protein
MKVNMSLPSCFALFALQLPPVVLVESRLRIRFRRIRSSVSRTTSVGQTKDYKIGNCCFTDKHAALRRKSKDLMPQDNISEWDEVISNTTHDHLNEASRKGTTGME